MGAIVPRTVPSPFSPGTIADLDLLFRGFADPIRIRVLNVLVAGELCVCDLVDLLRLPQSTVSRHLRYLHRAGLVEVTREWKFAHYRLAAPTLPVHRTLLSCVRTCFSGIAQLDRERAAAEAKVKVRAAEPC
jgi:ArsR family transcriptional regulator, arsenate/arsenite/antimonite-responsive transcriptional repressor